MQTIKIAGTTVITACPPNDIALAPVGDRNTAFTAELLKLLRDGSPVPDAPLDVNRLFGSLRAAMLRRGLPSPKMQAGDTSGSLWLRRPEGTAPEPAGPAAAQRTPLRESVEPELPPLQVQPSRTPDLEERQPRRQSMMSVVAHVPRDRPATPSRVRAGFALVRSITQWFAAYFFLSYGTGCLAGAVFGPSPGTDLAAAAATAPIGAVSAFFLIRRRVRRLGLRARSAIRILLPQSGPEVDSVLNTAMVLVMAACSIGVLGNLTDTSPDKSASRVSAVSNLAITTSMTLLCCALIVTIGYRLFKRRRS
jgi:hypothetical protein